MRNSSPPLHLDLGLATILTYARNGPYAPTAFGDHLNKYLIAPEAMQTTA